MPQLRAAIKEGYRVGLTDYNSCLFEAKRMLVGLEIKQRDLAIAEDLRAKRGELNRQILKEKEEKAKIQEELSMLTGKLQKIDEGLARKIQTRSEYVKKIQDTEAAYPESSPTLPRKKPLPPVPVFREACEPRRKRIRLV
ncbi:DIP13 [Symbiodinium sp. CCMP2592]|nr:DIP13 [Symbiodinium sp. CCMP2592]